MSNTPVSDTWERGNPSERYIGRWSRQVAPAFLSWLDIESGKRWLDVGCGTGALCAAIIDACAPSSVTGVEPSTGFRAIAAHSLGNRVALHDGSAASLPLADSSVDVTVSGLVLDFVPDLPAALAEMSRVIVPGGTIVAYVWDYAGRMELIRWFWDIASELDPNAATLHEGVRFPLCNPDALLAEFSEGRVARAGDPPDRCAHRFRQLRRLLEPVPRRSRPGPSLRNGPARRGQESATRPLVRPLADGIGWPPQAHRTGLGHSRREQRRCLTLLSSLPAAVRTEEGPQ